MKKLLLQDLVLSAADEGNRETGRVSLDAIRYAYLFLPGTFKWAHLLTSQTEFRYVDLMSLDVGLIADLFALLALQPERSWREFEFVLTDLRGATASFDFSDTVRSDVDVMKAISENRAACAAGLETWMAGEPSIVSGAVTFRPDGVVLHSGIIPWGSLDRIEVARADSLVGGGTYVHFVPVRGSGFRKTFVRVGSADFKAFFAEVDFWRRRFPCASGGTGSGAGAAGGRTTRKAVTCLVITLITVVLVVIVLLIFSRSAGRRSHAETGLLRDRIVDASSLAEAPDFDVASGRRSAPSGINPSGPLEAC
jgi:hypothetical protein